MRLALSSDRRPGPLQPRNGNRIRLVTCIVTVIVAVFVVLKVTGSSCPADPRADQATAAGGASPDTSPASRMAAGGTGAGGTGASALAASPALARSAIEGHAVFYDPGQAAGSCGLGPFPAGGRYASLPLRSYASGRACGSYLDVYGPRGTVRAEVVDVCTDCAAGTVNLSRAAFARIADPGTGLVAVSYRTALDPPLPGPLVLRFSAAARPGALAVQVINHGNRLSSVAASRPGGRWQRLAPSADGYWIGPLGPGRPRPGAAGRAAGARIRVRVTDAAGHQVVLTGISGRTTVLHATPWMYRGRGLAGSQAALSPATAARAGRDSRPAGPTGSC
jgi:expansin (peptidoglycan-binding protein)